MSSEGVHETTGDIILSADALEVINAIGQIIGHGGHGTIHTHTTIQNVVIKEICTDNMSIDNIHHLVEELNIQTHLSHSNVLNYDKIILAPGFLYVTMPRCSESVESILRTHKRKQQRLPIEKVFKITQHIAAGLAYLHAENKVDGDGNKLPVIIHGDLKLDNVLVDEYKTRYMVADIGLRGTFLNQNTKGINGPLYIAPEVLSENNFSTAADMWSFGAMIYELETCVKFMPYKDSDTGFSLPNNWIVDLSLVKDAFIKSMLEHLLVLNPKDRLSADEVATICGAPTEDISLTELKSAATHRICEVQIQKNREKRRLHQYTTGGDDYSVWVADFDTLLMTTNLLNEDDADENEQIMWAARNDNASIIEKLLVDGVVLKRNKAGMTYLMYAAQIGSINVVKLLIEYEQCLQDNDGKTALMYAIINGHDTIAKLLCNSEIMICDNKGRTALMYATITRRYELVEHLAKYETRSQDINGVTALMYAARIGYIDVIEILAEKEAGMKDTHNETAIFYALKSRNEDVAVKINRFEYLNDSIGRTALMLATTQNNLEKVRLFLPLHSKKKTTAEEVFHGLTVKGRTALMEAAAFGRIDAAKILIENEVRIQDQFGRTALMYAAAGGHLQIIELLIDHEKDIKDNNNQSALYYVTKNASMALLELLVSNVDPTDDKGVTALMRAADTGNTQVVKALIPLQKGLVTCGEEEIYGYTINERTALMGAAAYGQTNIIELLLKYEKGMTNYEGLTALKIAQRYNNQSAIAILSECPEENV